MNRIALGVVPLVFGAALGLLAVMPAAGDTTSRDGTSATSLAGLPRSTPRSVEAEPYLTYFSVTRRSRPANVPTVTPSPTAPAPTPMPMEMVLVPAGSFQMGCDPDNYELNQCGNNELVDASTSAYRIDRTEVTNAQYAECVAAAKCTPPKRDYLGTRRPYYGNPTYNNYPVLHVNVNQAAEFCDWVGKRLPTATEWEKAARGSGDTRNYPWGNTKPNCGLANFRPDLTYCVGSTSPVGAHPAGASPYGVLDMAGNVSEFLDKRAIRGGSWEDFSIGLELWISSTISDPQWSSSTIGFRCVANP